MVDYNTAEHADYLQPNAIQLPKVELKRLENSIMFYGTSAHPDAIGLADEYQQILYKNYTVSLANAHPPTIAAQINELLQTAKNTTVNFCAEASNPWKR